MRGTTSRDFLGQGLVPRWVGPLLILLTVTAPFAKENTFSGRVTHVTAGDTLSVQTGSRTVPVRLAGIDAPQPNEAFGVMAAKRVRDLTLGRTVLVLSLGQDPRGRVRGKVTLPDGRLLNRVMVASGLARWDRRDASTARELKSLEEEARAAARGMWRNPAPEPANPPPDH